MRIIALLVGYAAIALLTIGGLMPFADNEDDLSAMSWGGALWPVLLLLSVGCVFGAALKKFNQGGK